MSGVSLLMVFAFLSFVLLGSLIVGVAFWRVALDRSRLRREIGRLVLQEGGLPEVSLEELSLEQQERHRKMVKVTTAEVEALKRGEPVEAIARQVGLSAMEVAEDGCEWGLLQREDGRRRLSWEIRQGLLASLVVFSSLLVAVVLAERILGWLSQVIGA